MLNFEHLNTELLVNMYCVILLVPSNFSRQLDEVAAINLASVSGIFASFKYSLQSSCRRQTTPTFRVERHFSWHTLDLFLGLFSGFGRSQ